MTQQDKIAICGIGGLFPGAPDLDAYWHNILHGVDASRSVPQGRWPLAAATVAPGHLHLDADQAYNARGYYIEEKVALDFSRLQLKPADLAGLDPLFGLTLRVASDAFFDSAWQKIDRSRTGIIAGNILLPTAGSSRLAQSYLGAAWAEQLTGSAIEMVPGDPRDQFPAALPIGLAAEALGLAGGSYALDAACASTLYALHFASLRLQSGAADAMLAGGVCRPDSLYTQIGFSQLSALAPSGRCRPLTAQADGLLVGEGGGMFLLKRLADALAHGDRIYGVITSIGLSNDLKGGLVAPSSEGQLRAMRSAYAKADLSPHDIQLIECHATGTPLGDRIELASLGALWEGASPAQRCVISGVKGNVGHLLTASGAASLVKVLLALRHKILPPTIQEGADLAAWQQTPFDLLRQPRDWPSPALGGPRRAAVSGFGFGGINAHLVIEEYLPTQNPRLSQEAVSHSIPKLAIVGMAVAKAAGDSSAAGAEGPLDNYRWWGAEKCHWLKTIMGTGSPLHVRAIEQIEVPLGRYRIAPRELAKMSPQQLLFLDVSYKALDDAGLSAEEKIAGGVFVGVGLDAQASHFSCRWHKPSVPLQPPKDERASMAREQKLSDTLCPPLDAERTIGNLGAMTASRVVREFHFGGMGLTFSSDENSGAAALEAAGQAIAAGDITVALVGAVDFAASLGYAVSLARLQEAAGEAGTQPPLFGDGAVALVVMEAARAEAQGREIYATIEESTLVHTHMGATGEVEHQSKLSFGAATTLLALADRIHALSTCSPQGSETVHCSARDGSLAKIKVTVAERHTMPKPSLSHESKIQRDEGLDTHEGGKGRERAIQKIEVGARAFTIPAELAAQLQVEEGTPIVPSAAAIPATEVQGASRGLVGGSRRMNGSTLEALADRLLRDALLAFAQTQAQTVAAHESYFTKSRAAMQQLYGLAQGEALLRDRVCAPSHPVMEAGATLSSVIAEQVVSQRPSTVQPMPAYPTAAKRDAVASHADSPQSFDYAACLEFARGSIGHVLGERFAVIDSHRARVRLPDEPLLLCHRILNISGEPLSMSHGRITTEHDILPTAFYLDDGLIPIGIAVEAGQADLFLAAYLGIDLKTKGNAKYRLLDALVTFHSSLPRIGATIRYDIVIHHFFAQGETRLFRFGFTATVDGKPLMTMKNGVAGFFTDKQLAEGRGIVGGLNGLSRQQGRQVNFAPLVPMALESYDEAALDALRKGDYLGCFGKAFAAIDMDIASRKRLPDGMMRLVHRIVELDPAGGRYGVGRIIGEADIHPDDWFLACHFVDDKVMPGTLMYECCFQTLRVFLMRVGWVGPSTDLACEPIPGASSSLRCRGQVLVTTKIVTYEIHLKEIGYGPDAYAMADALMYADGKLIVEINNMTLTHPGFTRAKAQELWTAPAADIPLVPESHPATSAPLERPAADLLNSAQIRAFAGGKPSEAFGAPYVKFDDGRHFVARLPMDPYLFIDQVVSAEHMVPMVMKADGLVQVAFDMKGDEWFFAAEKTPYVPYCVLNEMALQACGFLAAYMGSALTVGQPLYFRNLAGAARLRKLLHRDEGRIITKARCISIVKARDLILQRYDFQLQGRGDEEIYRGQTEFGFFTGEALSAQIGIRKRAFDPQAVPGEIPAKEWLAHAAMPVSPLLMIDDIVVFDPAGGRLGLGYIKGCKKVDPTEWFFKAHFLNDPVMPGSLGLEGFIQLLKVCALERFGSSTLTQTLPNLAMASGVQHSWLYRGQVLPGAKLVEWEVQVHDVDEEGRRITAGGMLWVDGLCIYQVKDFCVTLVDD